MARQQDAGVTKAPWLQGSTQMRMEDETPERSLRSLAGLKPSHYTTAACISFVRINGNAALGSV